RVLVGGGALTARDDRTGVSHALAGGRGDPRDVGDDGFAHEAADVACGGFLVAPPDLAHQDDAFGAGIAFEEREPVDEVHATHRIAADADAGALAESDVSGLKDRLIGEGARARHDADGALLVDESGHDADLALTRSDDSGAVRPDEPR